ncbi:MAG: FAD-dependent monooxygenase, partial [Actinobacteria bacterium]|nr:FAD-dependent monooxygenase [Actinomycetota bacterium]
MDDVIVVGAGPVGMLLATELARRGVAATLIDRRSGPGEGSRAVGLHATALAALGPSGTAARILATAHRVERGEARSRGRVLGTVQFDRLHTQHPFVATTPQAATEAALAASAGAAGVAPPSWSTTVERVTPSSQGVAV